MNSTRYGGRRAGILTCAAAAALVLAGCSGPAPERGARTEQAASDSGNISENPATAAPHAPSPDATDAAGTSGAESASAEPEASAQDSDDGPAHPDAMPASQPTRISIPSLGVESELMQLGLQQSGQVEVPPYGAGAPAGWYRHSPTPGEIGPSVILGHRNAIEGGGGIFADLPSIEPGASVEVVREDGSTATFEVERNERYDVDAFPTLEVYGNTDAPELRLITCEYLNTETGLWEGNYITYARLVS